MSPSYQIPFLYVVAALRESDSCLSGDKIPCTITGPVLHRPLNTWHVGEHNVSHLLETHNVSLQRAVIALIAHPLRSTYSGNCSRAQYHSERSTRGLE